MTETTYSKESIVGGIKAKSFSFSTDDDFALDKIFNCGQCFRWSKQADGSFLGAAGDKAAILRKDGNVITISGMKEDNRQFWENYFDMGNDYRVRRAKVANCEYMARATEFGAGIRILNQNRWEALCSFIISQCNNIKRITGIIERFCALYGEAIPFEKGEIYAFPKAELVAGLSEKDLAPLRSGYRASYILSAAREIAEGRLNLDRLAGMPTVEAKSRLKELPGIGEKVANCVLLFGLGKTDAFPIDVWMKRALKEHFPKEFDPAVFGENAGLAQQYIFFMSRNEG